MDVFLHYVNDPKQKQPCWMEPVKLAFLSDAGFQMLEFTFWEITPTNTSELNLSYAATVASYNSFSINLRYNRFDIN
jgi:hypothetical protein